MDPLFLWCEDFFHIQGRHPTMDDVTAAFPNVTHLHVRAIPGLHVNADNHQIRVTPRYYDGLTVNGEFKPFGRLRPHHEMERISQRERNRRGPSAVVVGRRTEP